MKIELVNASKLKIKYQVMGNIIDIENKEDFNILVKTSDTIFRLKPIETRRIWVKRKLITIHKDRGETIGVRLGKRGKIKTSLKTKILADILGCTEKNVHQYTNGQILCPDDFRQKIEQIELMLKEFR